MQGRGTTGVDLWRPLCGITLGSLLCWAPCGFADLSEMRVGASVDVTYDDNVSRARKADKFHDWFSAFDLGARIPWSTSVQSRVIVSADAGADKFGRYTGLDRYYANVQGEFQYRNSGDYGDPTWSVFLRHGQDWYDSDLRDGSRTSAGIAVAKPITDRVLVFSALSYNQRNARSSVFDTKDVSLRGNVDYAISPRQTIYMSLEGRDGDITSTASPKPAYFQVAKASVVDDVFTDMTRYSYRFKAYTGIAGVGYNVAIGERAALDLSYRVAYSRLRDQPSASLTSDTIDYVDNQFSLSLLMRF